MNLSYTLPPRTQNTMFTGIIKTIGTVADIKSTKNETSIVIETDQFFKNKEAGNSIAINGVCLTITKTDRNKAFFNLMTETLKATNLKDIKVGEKVNMEPALTFGQGLDGHLVQGHVDTAGEIIEIRKESKQTTLRISYPRNFCIFLSLKGSITVNGVSLTISFLEEDFFEVCLVDHTLKVTNLSNLKKGDKVNLEFDAIAKYLKSLLDAKDRGFL